MKTPDASDLLGAVLFTPGLVVRFPVTKLQPVIKMVCSCKPVPVDRSIRSVDCTHKLYSTPELSGHVWVGRCESCGRWFYGAKMDKALLAKKPLVIKRHKILTRQK